SRLPRKCHLHFSNSRRLEVLKFIGVEDVAQGISAAVEEDRPPARCPLLLEGGSLLQKAAEMRHSGASPDHDHWNVWIGRRPEQDGRLADKGELRAVLHAARQVVGGHPVEVPVAAAGGPMGYPDRGVPGVR